jgi:hypothetical protein
MESIVKKATVVFMILIIAAMVIQVVAAETMGFDIAGLLRQKVSSMTDSSLLSVKGQLEQAKQETENNTVGYLDEYINNMKMAIEQYQSDETELAKQKIRSKGDEVVNALDEQKQSLLDSSKVTIKAKIDSDLNDTLEELDAELRIKIQEKLK